MNFSYILSPNVKQELERIENTRRGILLTLISPKIEIKIRFKNLIRIIQASLFLSGYEASESQIILSLNERKTDRVAEQVLQIKKAYDFLREECLLAQSKVEPSWVGKILRILGSGKSNIENVESNLDFINVSQDHPVVQAALAFILAAENLPDDNNSIKSSIMLSNVYLYDHGFDFRGLLNLPEFFANDLFNVKDKIKSAKDSHNLSDFIEYYVQAVSLQSEKALEIAGKISGDRKIDSVDLSSRDRKIISMFEVPNVRITNRDIQKEFGISQITASRNLSRLATLSLITRKGKGRSIYYIKV